MSTSLAADACLKADIFGLLLVRSNFFIFPGILETKIIISYKLYNLRFKDNIYCNCVPFSQPCQIFPCLQNIILIVKNKENQRTFEYALAPTLTLEVA